MHSLEGTFGGEASTPTGTSSALLGSPAAHWDSSRGGFSGISLASGPLAPSSSNAAIQQSTGNNLGAAGDTTSPQHNPADTTEQQAAKTLAGTAGSPAVESGLRAADGTACTTALPEAPNVASEDPDVLLRSASNGRALLTQQGTGQEDEGEEAEVAARDRGRATDGESSQQDEGSKADEGGRPHRRVQGAAQPGSTAAGGLPAGQDDEDCQPLLGSSVLDPEHQAALASQVAQAVMQQAAVQAADQGCSTTA
jgi:hypothetical protein